MSRINRRQFVVSTLGSIAAATPASAQAYPVKPITVLSSFGPGSPHDQVVRALADFAAKDLGHPVIVEPKPGAGGALAVAATATQKADGYTLGIAVTPALSTLPQMQKLTYDPARDFSYILQLVSFPLGIAVKAESAFTTWADVVARAKAEPGKVTYGTPGVGSMVNLGMLRLQSLAGISMTHVPHQNPMEIIPAVLGDHVLLMASGTEWKPQVDAGKMRLLMVWTEKRLPAFPTVPTLRESGHPFELDVSFGLVAPNGIDPAIVAKLDATFKKALASAPVRGLIEKFEMVSAYETGADFRTRMSKVGAELRPVIEQLGLTRKD